MSSIYMRKNIDGTTTWRAVVRRKGFPTECNHFSSEDLAREWADDVERKMYKIGKNMSSLKTNRWKQDLCKSHT